MTKINGTVAQNKNEFAFWAEATESDVSTPNNNSNVTVAVKLQYITWGWISNNKYTVSCTVNGTTKTTTYVPNVPSGSSTTNTIATFTFADIPHNDDGTKTVSISVNFAASGTYSPGKCQASGTMQLTKIARKSSLSVGNGTLGTALGLSVEKQDASFTHTITYACGDVSGTICAQTSEESISWTTSNGNILDLAAQNTIGTSVVVTFTITTFSGATEIGSNTATATMAIPESVKPTLSVVDSDLYGYVDTYGKYVQGKSTLMIDISAEGVYGSEITSCVTTFDGKSYTDDTITIETVAATGDQTIKTTITDTRGRSVTVEKAIAIYPYSAPQISAVKAVRCNSDGTTNKSGDHLKVTFTAAITSMDGQNSASYILQYKKITDEEYTFVSLDDYNGNFAIDGSCVFAASTASSYDIVIVATDDFGNGIPGKAKGASISVFWSRLKGGLGFALGKVAEFPNTFECAWNVVVHGDLTVRQKSLLDLTYPVGSVYMSVNSTDPSVLFGGTWERLKDRFLLAAGDSYTNGATGGEANHTLTEEEMPKHDHTVRTTRAESYPAYWHSNHTGGTNSSTGWAYLSTAGSENGGVGSLYVEKVGGSKAHNNMPPYLAVNMWKRTA